MGTLTIRPDAVGGYATGATVVGAASEWAATSDNSDASYLEALAPNFWQKFSSAAAIPATAQIRTVTPRVRHANAGSHSADGYIRFWLGVREIGGNGAFEWAAPYNYLYPTAPYSIVTSPGSAVATNPLTGLSWQRAELEGLELLVETYRSSGTATQRFHETYLDILYNEAPVVSAVTPSGTVSTSSQPSIGWTYSDPESDAQGAYQVRIFSAWQYNTPGFDPDSTAIVPWQTPMWDSGIINTGGSVASTRALQVGTALANNTSYRAYVRSSDAGSNGRWSAWAYSTFTITLDAPQTPTIIATADNDLQRIALTLQGQDNYLTKNQASLETDTTGWAAGANTTIARSTAQFANGAASLSLTAIAAGTVLANTPLGYRCSIGPSMQISALASLRAAATGRQFQLRLYWYKADGTASSVRASDTSGSVSDSSAGWTQNSLTVISPSDAAWCALEVIVLGAAIGEAHFVDKISVAPGASTAWTRGGFVASQQLVVEKSDDGGATWQTLRLSNAGAPPPITNSNWVDVSDATQRATVYDYEALPGTTRIYRVMSRAVDGDFILTSPWAQSAGASFTMGALSRLIPSSDPAKAVSVCHIDTRFSSDSAELQTVLYPQGRRTPIIHGSTIRAEVLEALRFVFENDAQWEAFETLRGLREPVLFITPFGDGTTKESYWVRLADRTVIRYTTDDMGTAQKREVLVGAREVAAPTVL